MRCAAPLIGPVLLGIAALLQGCAQKQDLQKLSVGVLQAGSGTAQKTQLQNVVPSKSPAERLTLIVEDERYLGDIARQLGTSVDALMALNQLADTLLQRGQVVLVETRRELVDQFVDKREKRKAARIAAEEAKRQDKLRKEAEARAAKRQKQLEARARKRGLKYVAAAPGTNDTGPTAVPLRAGEERKLDHGRLRGVSLPASFGVQ
ncbi:MAG: LysM peptidoglycan-binding domain-containing protein [Deltaproteobacteria bacterium]|nr:LysM peptidoglycan-binding domain-containing protein [Deltaproteobacteria bacterium]